MADDFSNDILLKVVAQVCEMVGYTSANVSPLNMLVDLLKSFIRNIAKLTLKYCELCGRSNPNLNDLTLAFHHIGILPSELIEFLEVANLFPLTITVPKYPVASHKHYFLQESPDNFWPGSLEPEQPTGNLKITISLSKIREAKTDKPVKRKKKKSNKENRKKSKNVSC